MSEPVAFRTDGNWTVRRLIEALQEFPPDLFVDTDDTGGTSAFNGVYREGPKVFLKV